MRGTGSLLTSWNIGIGTYALREVAGATPTNTQTAIGYLAGYQSTLTGTSNIMIGSNAAYGGALGAYNTLLGIDTLKNGSALNSNVILGVSSCNNADLGSSNIAIGDNVLRDVISSSTDYCVAMGYRAGYQASAMGDNQIVIGKESGYQASLTGDNLLLGWQAGYQCTVSSGANTIIGDLTGKGSTFVNGNTVVGTRALSSTAPYKCTVGSYVIAIGNRAGEAAFGSKTFNDGCILIGREAGRTGITTSGSNELIMGYASTNSGSQVTGRWSLQGRETLATSATAGAQSLPANPDCFIPIRLGNTLYKMPAYLP
jgi:hypothetical protein